MKFWSPIVCVLISACATQLTDAGRQVRVNRSAELVASCKPIKLVSETESSGSDQSGNALRAALNEAGAAGADTLYILSSSTGAHGATVIAKALRCQ